MAEYFNYANPRVDPASSYPSGAETQVHQFVGNGLSTASISYVPLIQAVDTPLAIDQLHVMASRTPFADYVAFVVVKSGTAPGVSDTSSSGDYTVSKVFDGTTFVKALTSNTQVEFSMVGSTAAKHDILRKRAYIPSGYTLYMAIVDSAGASASAGSDDPYVVRVAVHAAKET